MSEFPRITRNPAVMASKPCIRGMRVTVRMILGNLGAGVSIDELLAAYPYLEREDVLEAIRYAAWCVERGERFERAREIAAMTPREVQQTDSVQLLREERDLG
jgi:uncharacterized protein (DUF433 family)